MIAKYSGTCMYCQRPTKAGVDEYNLETKQSFHIECDENQPPSPEQFALADRLGFVPHDEAMRASWK